LRSAPHGDAYQRFHRLARFRKQARFLIAHPQAERGLQVFLPQQMVGVCGTPR
jgi:hypothetical protein